MTALPESWPRLPPAVGPEVTWAIGNITALEARVQTLAELLDALRPIRHLQFCSPGRCLCNLAAIEQTLARLKEEGLYRG